MGAKPRAPFDADAHPKTSDDYPLFPVSSPLVGTTDPSTSGEAARSIAKKLTALQLQVLAAFARLGPQTPKEIERLPEFAELAPSTVRKRCTELHRAGHLDRTDDAAKRGGCFVLAITPKGKAVAA